MTKKQYSISFCICLVVMLVCIGGLIYEEGTIARSKEIYQELRLQRSNPLPITTDTNFIVEETALPKGQIAWEQLQKEIPDLVAWLEGAGMDYPVVQGKDNHYYLTHLPNKSHNALGSVFLDAELSRTLEQPISILYAHSAEKENLFGALAQYRSQEFYEQNRELMLYTPKQDYRIVLFAAYLVDADTEVYPRYFETEQAWQDYMKMLQEKSFFHSDVEMTYPDRMILLSTCAYDFENARLAVVGKLEKVY